MHISLVSALGISMLIHLVLVVIFVVNQTTMRQFKSFQSQGITINLNAISTISKNVTSQSNDIKAIKKKLTQPNTVTSETMTAYAALVASVKPNATSSISKSGKYRNNPTDAENTPSEAPPVTETIVSASSKIITPKSTVKAKLQNSAIITKPVYQKWNKPVYPHRSIVKKQQGKVLLDVHVDTRGRAIGLEIHKSSGHPLLDRAAIKSVKHWIFEPVQQNGVKIDAMVRVPVNFTLAQK